MRRFLCCVTSTLVTPSRFSTSISFLLRYMFTSTDMSTLNILTMLKFSMWSIEKQFLIKILFLKYFTREVFSYPEGHG